MSKQQTIGDIISKPPRMSETSEIIDRMGKAVKTFDEYERKEGENFYRCKLCNPGANLYPESEIFPDDEYVWLCGRCLSEIEQEREEEERREKLAREEEINHHK